MALQIEQDASSSMLGLLGRHMVALCLTFQRESETEFRAYAGLLLQIDGVTNFLTAGHVLRAVETALSDATISVTEITLADIFGWKRISELPIPFDLRKAPRIFIDDDESGLDFGLVLLDPHYVRLLNANGVIPETVENLRKQVDVQFDSYAMLGLPEEFTSRRLQAGEDATLGPTLLRVRAVSESDAEIVRTINQRFVGKVDDALPIKSLRGMSGGPIFGFRSDKIDRYWIVALQSSWDRRHNFVYGCPMLTIADLVTKWLADLPEPEALTSS
jgi:hypothetical protein